MRSWRYTRPYAIPGCPRQCGRSLTIDYKAWCTCPVLYFILSPDYVGICLLSVILIGLEFKDFNQQFSHHHMSVLYHQEKYSLHNVVDGGGGGGGYWKNDDRGIFFS